MPKVSIIVPAYNTARYIGEAIQSILDQTFTDWETIIIDDGSTDDTREVVGRFTDSRIRYVYQQNGGISAARNTGLQLAEGEYIALLDADDRWEKLYLERAIQALELAPEAGAVYCGFHYMDAAGQPLAYSCSWVAPPAHFREHILKGHALVPSGVVARKKCYQAIGGFDPNPHILEDMDMWLRMSERFAFVGIPEILVWYRRSGTNFTDNLERMFRNALNLAEKHVGPAVGAPESWPADKRYLYLNIYRHATARYTDRGDLRQAAQYLSKAFRIEPDLASDVDFWYRLACAHQPSGNWGDWHTLNLTQAQHDLITLLADLWSQDDLSSEIRKRRAMAYGHVYLVLGLLAYGRRDLRQARQNLMRALVTYPRIAARRRWSLTLLKSFLGKRLLPRRW